MSANRALKMDGWHNKQPHESGWYERLYGETVYQDWFDRERNVWRMSQGGKVCTLQSKPWRPLKPDQ